MYVTLLSPCPMLGAGRGQAAGGGGRQLSAAEGGRGGHLELCVHHSPERQDQQRGGGGLEGPQRAAQVSLASPESVEHLYVLLCVQESKRPITVSMLAYFVLTKRAVVPLLLCIQFN